VRAESVTAAVAPATPGNPPAAPAGVAKDAVNDATSKLTEPDIRFTVKGDVIYLFARSWLQPQVTVTSFARLGTRVQKVTLLGSSAPLTWRSDKDKLVIDLPQPMPTGIPIYTFRIEQAKAEGLRHPIAG
jgi:alpha-L-fucosidase